MSYKNALANALSIAFMALLLSACASKTTMPDPAPTDSYTGSNGASANAGDENGVGRGEEIPYNNEQSSSEMGDVIYFDFDSSEVRAEDAALITRHAMQLAGNPALRVRLEGHTDERGSREYNIGLGERRAQSVRRLLLIQGASAAQISTVSFGEERPVAFGSDEASYAKNRRVEISYVK